MKTVMWSLFEMSLPVRRDNYLPIVLPPIKAAEDSGSWSVAANLGVAPWRWFQTNGLFSSSASNKKCNVDFV